MHESITMKQIAILICLALCACTTQTITTIDPVTGKPIVTKTTSQDPKVAGAIAQGIAEGLGQAVMVSITGSQGGSSTMLVMPKPSSK